MDVRIVGVDHRIQYKNKGCGPEWTQRLNEFESDLGKLAVEHSATLIAEEFTQEMVAANHAQESVAQTAARGVSVSHLFCDPDTNERAAMGNPSGEAREAVWLHRLDEAGHDRVVFVCGDDHVESFSELLLTANHQAVTVETGRGKGWQFIN